MTINSFDSFASTFTSPSSVFRMSVLSTLETPEERKKYLKQHPIYQESAGHWGVSVVNKKGAYGLILTEGNPSIFTDVGNVFLYTTALIDQRMRKEIRFVEERIHAVTSQVIQAKNAVGNTWIGKEIKHCSDVYSEFYSIIGNEAKNYAGNTWVGKKIHHWSDVYSELHLHLGTTDSNKSYYIVFSRDSEKLHSGFTKGNAPDLISPYDINLSFREDIINKDVALMLFPTQRMLHAAGRINLLGEATLEYAKIVEAADSLHDKFEYGKHLSEIVKAHPDDEDHHTPLPRDHSVRVPHDSLGASLKDTHSYYSDENHRHGRSIKHENALDLADLRNSHNVSNPYTSSRSKKTPSEHLDHSLTAERDFQRIEIAAIEQALQEEKDELKNIYTIIAEKEKHYGDLEHAWEEQKTAEVSGKILNFVNIIALEIYKEQKNMMEARQRKLEFSNMQHQHAATVRQMNASPQESLSLPFIQNRVFQSVTPYWSIKNRLEEVQNYATEYREAQEQLAHMLEERKHLITQTDAVEQKLSEHDQEIQHQYQDSLNKKRKIIKELQTISTAMNLSVGLVAGIPLAGPASGGIDILTNHFRNQESQEMNTLQNMLKVSAEMHLNLATMRNANFQEMTQIRQSIENGRRMLLTAVKNNAITPREGRDILQKECGQLEQEIESVKQGIQKSYGDKSSVEYQRAVVAQRLTTYGYCSPHKHRIAFKNREQDKLNIISLDTQAIQLTKIILSQTEELAQKEKLLKQYKDNINIQLPLAAIKDFLFDQLVEEIGKNNDWEETVKGGLAQINSVRNARMQTINSGFSAFEQLFGELTHLCNGRMSRYSHKAQIMTSLFSQGYNICELFKTFEQGKKVFSLTLNSLAAGQTIIDAIVKMGPMVFLTNCIVPGVQMLTVTLTIFRCAKQLVSNAREEVTIGQLGNFLESITKHFNDQINILAKGITEQHLEVKKILSTILTVSRELCEETKKEIQVTRQILLKEIRHINYLSETRKSYALGEKMIENCQKSLKLIRSLENRKDQEKSLNKLIIKMEYWLRLTMSDTYSGLTPIRLASGEDSLKVVVPLEEIKYNPEIYTRVLGFKIKNKSNIPSFYLLKCVAKCYTEVLCVVKCYSEVLKDELVDENQIAQLARFGDVLKKHTDRVFKLCGSFTSFAMQVREQQQAVFSSWQQTIQKVEVLGRELENSLIEQYLSAYSFNDSLVGSSKFEIGLKLTQNHFKTETRKAKTIVTNTALAAASSGVIFSVAAGAVKVGAALLIPGVGIPVACLVTVSEIVVIGAAAGFSKSSINNQQKFAELIDMQSIFDLKKQFREKNINWLVDSKKNAITEVWLSKKGELKADFYKPRSIGTVASVGKISKSKHYPFHAKFLMSDVPTVTASPDSQINIAELEHIQNHFPVLDKEVYGTQASKLKRSYESWLKKEVASENSEENPFQALAQSSLLICPKNPSLLPLLFPVEVIEGCVSIEKKMLALKHEAPLVPIYSFEYNEQEQTYRLSIDVNGIVNGQNVPFMTFEIAEFDKVTVESFKKISFEESSEVNLNEFLIQAMYTRVCNNRPEECLFGLSGSSTIFINNDQWVVPIERFFPGLHLLLKNNPNTKFCFNHKNYTEEVSIALMTFATTKEFSSELLPFFVARNPRLLPNALEFHYNLKKLSPSLIAEIEPLIESYKLLTAFFCLVSSADEKTMETTFESWLGVLPMASNQDLIERFTIGLLSEEPTEDSIGHFDCLLEKTNSYAEFLKKLESI